MLSLSQKQAVLIKEVLASTKTGYKVSLNGWVRTRRDNKGFSFLELNDGSSLSNLQVVADASLEGFEENVLRANTGASVQVEGEVVESQAKGQKLEVQAASVTLIGEAAEDYVLQKKRHGRDYLRTIPHLRARTNLFGSVFRLRSVMSGAIHRFYSEEGFHYINTPIITASDCEGAGAMFSVVGPEHLEKLKQKQSVKSEEDFFGQEVRLTVSGQLEAEAMALALGRVYTFSPTFRAENSNTTRHLAEFWMVEPEAAFFNLADNKALAERFIKFVIKECLEKATEEMELFDKFVEKGILASLEQLITSNFEHLSYTEAIEVLKNSGKKFEFEPNWGQDLQTEHERYLTDEYCKKAVFVTDYPRTIKPFYMRDNDDGKTVGAMDLLVPRLGEIIGGSQREERLDVLQTKMKEAEMSEEEYQWFIDLRRFGSAPHSGFGLGLERLVMYVSGIDNIRDVIVSPRTPGNASF